MMVANPPRLNLGENDGLGTRDPQFRTYHPRDIVFGQIEARLELRSADAVTR